MTAKPPSRSRTTELRRLARELEPTVAPYYVSVTDDRHRAPGWYMTPKGHAHPTYLGAGALAAGLYIARMKTAAAA